MILRTHLNLNVSDVTVIIINHINNYKNSCKKIYYVYILYSSV